MSDCSDARDYLVGEFYEWCPQSRYSDAAQAHLLRLAEYAACYAKECHYASDPDWWERTGKAYWKGHVATLFTRYLRCPTDDSKITCGQVQKAVNEYADTMKRVIRRSIANDKIDDELAKFIEGLDPAAVEGLEDWELFALFTGCPFLAEFEARRLPGRLAPPR